MLKFTSDQHFGHERILTLGDGRPFKNLAHMHSVIIKNWWETVAWDDDVYVLGDSAMGSFEDTIKLFKGLPGNKFFVPGNHDKIFPKLNTKSRIEKFTPFYEEVGFTVLPLWHEMNIETSKGSTPVLLSHVPYSKDRFEGRQDKLKFARPEDKGLPLIHGHTHSREVFEYANEFHVGVDAHNYYPVSEPTIVEWLESIQ